jgi:hypothetical protein
MRGRRAAAGLLVAALRDGRRVCVCVTRVFDIDGRAEISKLGITP